MITTTATTERSWSLKKKNSTFRDRITTCAGTRRTGRRYYNNRAQRTPAGPSWRGRGRRLRRCAAGALEKREIYRYRHPRRRRLLSPLTAPPVTRCPSAHTHTHTHARFSFSATPPTPLTRPPPPADTYTYAPWVHPILVFPPPPPSRLPTTYFSAYIHYTQL